MLKRTLAILLATVGAPCAAPLYAQEPAPGAGQEIITEVVHGWWSIYHDTQEDAEAEVRDNASIYQEMWVDSRARELGADVIEWTLLHIEPQTRDSEWSAHRARAVMEARFGKDLPEEEADEEADEDPGEQADEEADEELDEAALGGDERLEEERWKISQEALGQIVSTEGLIETLSEMIDRARVHPGLKGLWEAGRVADLVADFTDAVARVREARELLAGGQQEQWDVVSGLMDEIEAGLDELPMVDVQWAALQGDIPQATYDELREAMNSTRASVEATRVAQVLDATSWLNRASREGWGADGDADAEAPDPLAARPSERAAASSGDRPDPLASRTGATRGGLRAAVGQGAGEPRRSLRERVEARESTSPVAQARERVEEARAAQLEAERQRQVKEASILLPGGDALAQVRAYQVGLLEARVEEVRAGSQRWFFYTAEMRYYPARIMSSGKSGDVVSVSSATDVVIDAEGPRMESFRAWANSEFGSEGASSHELFEVRGLSLSAAPPRLWFLSRAPPDPARYGDVLYLTHLADVLWSASYNVPRTPAPQVPERFTTTAQLDEAQADLETARGR